MPSSGRGSSIASSRAARPITSAGCSGCGARCPRRRFATACTRWWRATRCCGPHSWRWTASRCRWSRAPRAVELAVVDLSSAPEREREAEALRQARAEAQRPFDLTGDTLLRATLLRLGKDDHLLLLVMHHIVTDGWSMSLLVRRARTALRGLRHRASGRRSPSCRCSTATSRVWQHESLRGAVLDAQLAYWRDQLAGAAGAGAADRSAAARRADAARRHRARGVPAGAARAAQGGEPRGQRDALHDAAGGVSGLARAVHGPGRRGGRLADGRTRATSSSRI